MVAPVAIPPQSPATPDHGAGQIARARRDAPGRRPTAPRAAFRPAGQGRTAHEDMALSMYADTLADQPDQRVPSLDRRGRRTGMPATATAIHFPSSNPGKTNTRSFGAPDRTVAIPHPGGCAGEGLARGLSQGSGKEEQSEDHWSAPWGPGPYWGSAGSIANLGLRRERAGAAPIHVAQSSGCGVQPPDVHLRPVRHPSACGACSLPHQAAKLWASRAFLTDLEAPSNAHGEEENQHPGSQ